MDIADLQTRLGAHGYPVPVDGRYGPLTRATVLAAMTDPPDRLVTASNVKALAESWAVDPAAVWAIRDVEATGKPFVEGRPTILFEPHRFSRATGRRFDADYPKISYRVWDRSKYPATQRARWDQPLDAVRLDVDAAFASASYGAFQVLGENFAACGEADSFAFALSEAQGEDAQLKHFGRFVEQAGLVPALRRLDWAAFARGYNGSAYFVNRYDERLATAFRERRKA
ncbi:N-acetylmuramidase domain-containing protein [Sphingomonas immobilis]|uniref:N-acetylmuramidase domain-containing protein n=1 Tax=Sphingomonas immobilis TaxID=3063997 RepID=A0ABT9A282_9SPHN|nr:N-acetylmuramidase domain-containing protein [Sphingomonas sp. CA1-15]MDO7843469.1 N-acetylmuramidase domain-containing protein [Sphingomonas sp. CA1-15]